MVARFTPAESTRPTDRAARAELSRREAVVDAELVRRFNAGDAPAFVEIVTRYREKMFHVALGLLHNRADAEEVAQDTFIRAHRSLARFRGDSSLAAWLYCITLNLARNRYWFFFRRRRQDMLPLDAPLRKDSQATFAELVACEEPGPVREAVNSEFSRIITDCMEQLTSGQREILRLRNVQHHSYLQISRTLGIGLGTAKSRIARARTMLRGLLARAYGESTPATSAVACFEGARATGRLEAACA